MKKLLYLMHVPWGWIKQRPHFLAEQLHAYFEVRVFIRKSFEKSSLVENAISTGLSVITIPMLRLTSYVVFMDRLNDWMINRWFKSTINEYDIVWITRPDMYALVSRVVPEKATVIYDCMDDHMAFPAIKNNPRLLAKLQMCERLLVARSDLVIVSSEHLRNTLMARCNCSKEIVLVNNGINLDRDGNGDHLPPALVASMTEAAFSLTYIGTIASWLDLSLLLETVERFSQVTVFLFGPAEVPLPVHDRIIHCGPIEHRQIWEAMEMSNCLVMPFVLDELVKGVDPVKLYEYVYSGKPAVALQYPETEKFAGFIHLYADSDAYFKMMGEIVAGMIGAKRPLEECRTFTLQHTWSKRAEQIVPLIECQAAVVSYPEQTS